MSILYIIKKGRSDEPAIIVVHAVTGTASDIGAELIKSGAVPINNSASIYGLDISANIDDTNSVKYTSVAGLAQEHIATLVRDGLLKQHQSIVLVSWSFGALVAFEMAKSLAASPSVGGYGVDIPLVCLVDPPRANLDKAPPEELEHNYGRVVFDHIAKVLVQELPQNIRKHVTVLFDPKEMNYSIKLDFPEKMTAAELNTLAPNISKINAVVARLDLLWKVACHHLHISRNYVPLGSVPRILELQAGTSLWGDNVPNPANIIDWRAHCGEYSNVSFPDANHFTILSDGSCASAIQAALVGVSSNDSPRHRSDSISSNGSNDNNPTNGYVMPTASSIVPYYTENGGLFNPTTSVSSPSRKLSLVPSPANNFVDGSEHKKVPVTLKN